MYHLSTFLTDILPFQYHRIIKNVFSIRTITLINLQVGIQRKIVTSRYTWIYPYPRLPAPFCFSVTFANVFHKRPATTSERPPFPNL